MNRKPGGRSELAALNARIKTLLPEQYQDSFEDVQPVSMGSAALKYGDDGKVAWNDMWATFCDLAMAGGPPHKGSLLEPASAADIDADPSGYDRVVLEICRGVRMVTELPVQPSPTPGWVRVSCLTESMSSWLMRAIVMENISAFADGVSLDLPAGPRYRLEKEIKNVVTVIAKTSHYLLEHMSRAQQKKLSQLFMTMAVEMPLIAPAHVEDSSAEAALQRVAAGMADSILRDLGRHTSTHRYTNWLGVECSSVSDAIRMMRALVATNVVSRREGTVLFLPVSLVSNDATLVVERFGRVVELLSN